MASRKEAVFERFLENLKMAGMRFDLLVHREVEAPPGEGDDS